MKLKNGVIITGLHAKMQIANAKAAVIWSKYGHELVITEAIVIRNSGFHPLGRASDYRVNYFTHEIQQQVARELQEELGSDYDVILHGDGDSIHVHCEYDPDNPKII